MVFLEIQNARWGSSGVLGGNRYQQLMSGLDTIVLPAYGFHRGARNHCDRD